VALLMIIGGIGIAALMFWNAVNWYGFESEYRYDSDFQGARYDCRIRFANLECSSPCFVGADESSLYLLAHPNSKGWWSNRAAVGFKKNLQIPWSDLSYRAGTGVYKGSIWFDLRTRKIHFYLPKDIGERLLTDARRLSSPSSMALRLDARFQHLRHD